MPRDISREINPSSAQAARLLSDLEELEAETPRREVEEQTQQTIREISATLFDRQRRLDEDTARRKAALCTRRAGKTDWVPKRLIRRALAAPESIRVYLAVTRVRAKELIWRHLEVLNERYDLRAKLNEQQGVVTLPNHAVIRLKGADDKREAQKGRGDKLHELVIDECQIFPPEVLKSMVDDVYGPTLEDVGGDISLLGTPGIVCAGEWWEITRPDTAARAPGWSVHQWSVLDNPYMAHMRARLPQLKAERNWQDDNPTWLREWCGQWVHDNEALFYRFDPTRNVHDLTLREMTGPGWMHVLGWDIGLRDDMALVAWAFHENRPEVYECFSWKENGVTSERVVEEVAKLEKLGLKVVGQVADTGGLGALVVEEVAKRFKVRFEAAKKTEKYAHVELFNDDLLTGRVKLMRGSPYTQEIAVLPKDPEGPVNKPPQEDPRFPNHCADAGLYGWRKALHWTATPLNVDPPAGTTAWQAAQAEAMRQQAVNELRSRQEGEQWEW